MWQIRLLFEGFEELDGEGFVKEKIYREIGENSVKVYSLLLNRGDKFVCLIGQDS